MKPFVVAGLALVVAFTLSNCATGGEATSYLQRFMAAEIAGKPFESITLIRPETTIKDAYRVQRIYVQHRLVMGDRIAGYKGGLMSVASLRSRNVTEPLVGTLFAAGWTKGGEQVSLCGYRKASFELKMGYILSSTQTGANERSMVAPIIDLPDIAYRQPDSYNAIDMVAANVSAARYVVGTARSLKNIDPDTISVSLAHDGKVIASGQGGESLGGQAASLTLVQKLARREARAPLAGDLIVTGKMGERGWLLPGAYVADYGALGIVRFTVTACSGGR